MEHLHNEGFCLSCTLLAVGKIVPQQAPIKDFIHQNILQAFIDLPFDEAVTTAAHRFGAKSYMDLSYYRERFNRGEISLAARDKAIRKSALAENKEEEKLLEQAMMSYLYINDRKAVDAIFKKNKRNVNHINKIENHLSVNLNKQQNKISISSLINSRLGFPAEHVINPLLFRLLGAYLDQGVSLWPYLESSVNFQQAVLELARHSKLNVASFINNDELFFVLSQNSDKLIIELLEYFIKPKELYSDFIHELLLNHPGWSGMVNMLHKNPDSLAKKRNLNLKQVLLVKLAFLWQLVKSKVKDFQPLDSEAIKNAMTTGDAKNDPRFISLLYWLSEQPLQSELPKITFLNKIDSLSLQRIWHEAFEESYYEKVFQEIKNLPQSPEKLPEKKFQAVFCIDDREASFRRYLEEENDSIETFSFPGFFGVDCYFQPNKRDLLEQMCPVTIQPKHVIMERPKNGLPLSEENRLTELSRFVSRHGANSMFFGFVAAYTLGHLSLMQLFLTLLYPSKFFKKNPSSEIAPELIFFRQDDNQVYKGLYLGYTHREMAERVYGVLNSMGLRENLAPLIFFFGHGSSSANNPHFATYECGACSGRPGALNARLFAAMANLSEVRELVREKGIDIANNTTFIGGFHDTCTDEIIYFDKHLISEDKIALFEQFSDYMKNVQEKNAKERCKSFALVSPKISEKEAVLEVKHRARALFEPRPEMGHTNNSLVLIGRRARSYKKDFNRRAFFQSYNPKIDNEGHILTTILSAAIPVCGGINLDYYFSRLDPAIYGCGTKLSHNVCSLIGVGNGLDDDLRTGLPIQMTELHEPIRLLFIIEQEPEIIIRAIQRNAALLPWVRNRWVHIAALDPYSNNYELLLHNAV
jgi:uncharacterized protein YbcC (UPF0753/DUF2309 family)